MAYLQDISGKKVAKYMILPGIIPRLRGLATKGFGELAFLMALIYGSVRLLPPGHPYLLPANKGRFGMRHVIAAAGARLVFKRENIDQILIFFALLFAFVLLVLQFAYVIVSFALHPAMAQTYNPTGMFDTPQAQRSTDVAFMLLDSVFGIPGFFGSCVDGTVSSGCVGPDGKTIISNQPFPTPFHLGLHTLFQFYSMVILLIGVLIFVYYVFIVVGETAQTGTPFGKRFDHIWAPIRLVVALGLLVPVSNGLNSAQYITLYAAKLGSGFATNAWTLYNQSTDTPLGLPATAAAPPTGSTAQSSPDTTNALIARPQPPEIYPLVQFMSLVQACRVAYETQYQNTGMKIHPYLVSGQSRQQLDFNSAQSGMAVPWTNALQFYQNQDIIIYFGDDGDYQSTQEGSLATTPTGVYPDLPGGVSPKCGEITLQTSDLSGVNTTTGDVTGTGLAEQGYYNLILAMWSDKNLINFGTRAACLHIKPPPAAGNPTNTKCTAPNLGAGDDLSNLPAAAWTQNQISLYQSQVVTTVDATYRNVLKTTDFTVNAILQRGWGGAGIWYTKLAQWNGALYDVTRVIPTVSRMPDVMEEIKAQKSGHDNTLNNENQYTPQQSNGQAIHLTQAGDMPIAQMLDASYQYLLKVPTAKTALISQSNVVIDAINWIFGSSGIFDLRQNDTVQPLAQLVALGKGIMDATFRNLLISMGFSAGGGFMGAMQWATMSGLATIGQELFSTFAIIGITIGFLLYYILPFMPFMYFYFAVGAWVKAIFEAMVGVPLWALAHLKIQGEGLPAQSAMMGYYLILEIFLRPILTIFGLLASVGILTALVHTLNSIFGLVTSNVSGFDCNPCNVPIGVPGVAEFTVKRDAYDQFFFTVIYTIVVYLMATSCFKLIDQIPDNVMRWIGANVQSFEADPSNAPGEKLGSYASVMTQQYAQQMIIPSLNSGAGLVGSATGMIANKLTGGDRAAPASSAEPAAAKAAAGSGGVPSAATSATAGPKK